MSLGQSTIATISEQLRNAEWTLTPIDSISKAHPSLSESDAYSIQLASANRGMRDGRRIVGYKVGLTSRAAQQHFKVFEPDFGHLFQDMWIPEGGSFELDTLIQAKVEGEIAFVMGRELRGPGVTIVDVLRAVEFALPAIEIIDSRIKNWDITACDTIADNGSSALFALGSQPVSIHRLELAHLGMSFEVNSEVAFTGAGAAVLGNPLNAVVFLANALSRYDRPLLPGDVVLSGALSGMTPVRAKDSYRCEIWKLGSVGIRVGGRNENV